MDYFLPILWHFLTLAPVQISVLVVGAVTGWILPVRATQWFQAALLFLAWGVLFESALAIGLYFTPYETRGTITIHLVFMLYRLTFAVGMTAGLLLSDRLGRQALRGTLPDDARRNDPTHR